MSECFNLLRLEFRKHDASGAHPQRAQQLVDDAVHVVQRQGVEDDVVPRPRPLRDQTLDLTETERGTGEEGSARHTAFKINHLSQLLLLKTFVRMISFKLSLGSLPESTIDFCDLFEFFTAVPVCS